MTIKVQVNHITHYKYDRPVNLSPQTIRLRPSPHNKVPVTSYSFNITPKEHFLNWYQDIYGNFLANIFFPEKITEFKIDVQVQADINIINPFDFFLDIKYEKWPFEYESSVKTELKQYLDPAEKGKLLMEFVGKLNTKQNQNKNTIDFLVEVNQAVNKALGYVIRLDPGVFTCEETLTKKLGSCRDMAWLLCQVYRHLGFAARFVSGYSIQLKADEKPVIGPAGVEQDIVDLHAWTEIYIPGAGWVGLDPTSGMLCGEGHIPLCASATFENAAPVSGLIDPCQSTIDHRMEVIRIHEDPRTTKPFSDLEWNEIEKTAQQIDKDILKQDIRLTI
ncbi:MAG TPA: IMP dehydrogenase, partial [Alphaproteobacteria bacterium]|nr:IMP dehydrogenase [Alphaproteobacteria bacterium]